MRLEGRFIHKALTFTWEQTVPLSLLITPFTNRSYETGFIKTNLSKTKELQKVKHLISLSILYYILSINNPNFANWSPLIYHPKELEIKWTTQTASLASFRDIYFNFDTIIKYELVPHILFIFRNSYTRAYRLNNPTVFWVMKLSQEFWNCVSNGFLYYVLRWPCVLSNLVMT